MSKSDATLTSKDVVFLPCPFCGSQPQHHSYVGYERVRSFAWVKCEPCRLQKELNCDGSDESSKRFVLQSVAHWWNTRHTPETRALRTWVDPNDPDEILLDFVNEYDQGNGGAYEFDMASVLRMLRDALRRVSETGDEKETVSPLSTAVDFASYDSAGGVQIDLASYLRTPAGQAQLQSLNGKKAGEAP